MYCAGGSTSIFSAFFKPHDEHPISSTSAKLSPQGFKAFSQSALDFVLGVAQAQAARLEVEALGLARGDMGGTCDPFSFVGLPFVLSRVSFRSDRGVPHGVLPSQNAPSLLSLSSRSQPCACPLYKNMSCSFKY